MEAGVGIFDLDVLESVEPILTLGADTKEESVRKNGKRKKKAKKVGLGHTDAVTSLAWNRITPHVLASGSADGSIILWDLDAGKGATKLECEGEEAKVLSLHWHPSEDALLLSADSTGVVRLWDCTLNETRKSWKLGGEVDAVLWDTANPFAFFASADGDIAYIDSRQDSPLWSVSAHSGALSSLAQSPSRPHCLASTSGDDTLLKIWKHQGDKLEHVGDHEAQMGGLHCASFCPDAGETLALGGSKGQFFRLLKLSAIQGVSEAFSLGGSEQEVKKEVKKEVKQEVKQEQE